MLKTTWYAVVEIIRGVSVSKQRLMFVGFFFCDDKAYRGYSSSHHFERYLPFLLEVKMSANACVPAKRHPRLTPYGRELVARALKFRENILVLWGREKSQNVGMNDRAERFTKFFPSERGCKNNRRLEHSTVQYSRRFRERYGDAGVV